MNTTKFYQSKNHLYFNLNGLFLIKVKNTQSEYRIATSEELNRISMTNGWNDIGVHTTMESAHAAWVEFRTAENIKRDERNAGMMERIEKSRAEDAAKLQALISVGVIPTTIENLKLVLRHLNNQNWGGWDLPKMSIGYSANQYDCEGSTATTITLNQPISDLEYDIENETKFKTGGKRGHLSNYRSI